MNKGRSVAQCIHPYLDAQGGQWATDDIRNYIDNASTCAECSILLQAVEIFKPGWIDRHKVGDGVIEISLQNQYTVHLREDPHHSNTEDSFQICYKSTVDPMYEYYEDYEAYSHSRSCRRMKDPYFQSLEVAKESFSQAAFTRARTWLSHCLAHDAACNIPNKEEFMPSNLINVGSWDGSQEPFLYKPHQPEPYVCLSYCWGPDTDDILKTTTENIDSHYKSIPLANMPLGVQDAITVCRGLQISSLWVDSLCIIQNDQVAWHKAASQMDRIYLHSRLTIAALEPASCKSRFLGQQRYGHPDWERHLVANVSLEQGEAPIEVFIRSVVDEDSDMDKKCSLDKRGWCLQESLLPSRRLCFNGDEMVWECLCRTICECGHILRRPQPFQFTQQAVSVKAHLLAAKVIRSQPKPAENVSQIVNGQGSNFHRWRELVTEFSNRSVSHKEDRFNAISGLAKLVRENLGRIASDQPGESATTNEYLAGLWRKDFLFGLAWMRDYRSSNTRTEISTMGSRNNKSGGGAELGIPSWSWASVDGPVFYKCDDPFSGLRNCPNLIDCVRVVSVSCQRKFPDDDTSEVLNGRAVLSGNKVAVKLTKLRSGSDSYTLQDQEYQLNAEGRSKDGCIVHVAIDRLETIAENKEHYCLRLFSWVPYSYMSWGEEMMGPETWFLVLRPSLLARGAFERIGLGVWATDLFKGSQEAIVEIVEKKLPSLTFFRGVIGFGLHSYLIGWTLQELLLPSRRPTFVAGKKAFQAGQISSE
ncbi:unnamed protein product [Clonostachys rosea]|uniref:Heterokaryon incompatibility domain-containing protein n=1 Tax=Bionectria ochroleuca TaxID=29856 RepID=A0ABY6U5E8_BIOOC|nr:unnamed protein product [Clonostachys rosea]